MAEIYRVSGPGVYDELSTPPAEDKYPKLSDPIIVTRSDGNTVTYFAAGGQSIWYEIEEGLLTIKVNGGDVDTYSPSGWWSLTRKTPTAEDLGSQVF
jgi:hypothetical protein